MIKEQKKEGDNKFGTEFDKFKVISYLG